MNRREALQAAKQTTKALSKLKRQLSDSGNGPNAAHSTRATFDDLHARVTNLGEIIKSVTDEPAA